MAVLDVIEVINKTYEDIYELIKENFTYRSSELNFTNGYCYEYFIILKKFFSTAVLVMQNDKMHCATLIDDKIYDVNGIREDKENFHIATKYDLEYIHRYYGIFALTTREKFYKEVTINIYNLNKGYSKKLSKSKKNIV